MLPCDLILVILPARYQSLHCGAQPYDGYVMAFQSLYVAWCMCIRLLDQLATFYIRKNVTSTKSRCVIQLHSCP